jgi:hypothetical protein
MHDQRLRQLEHFLLEPSRTGGAPQSIELQQALYS